MSDSLTHSSDSCEEAIELAITVAPTNSQAEDKKVQDTSECLIFQRPTASYRYDAYKRRRLLNNMLFGIGLLEFANAGDFAANVWNEVPAPTYALVLMGIGGTFALSVSYFAFKDATLSWNNVQLLRQERAYLRGRQMDSGVGILEERDLDCRLDVNFRESGTEYADRFGMDLIMGFAATLVGVGTLMAIGGENRRVFQASNLLSGYIGNGPAAFWGLTNVAWCIFVWKRVHQHYLAGLKQFGDKDPVFQMLRQRTRIVMWHAVIYGITGFLAGVASLLTSTLWYGYVALAPCILAAIGSNHIFRHQILYSRDSIQEMPLLDRTSLLRQLRGIGFIRALLRGRPSDSVAHLLSAPVSLPSLLNFIITYGLFEDFCTRIIGNPALVDALFGTDAQSLVLDSRKLEAVEGPTGEMLLEVAKECIADLPAQCSKDRETFLLETFGCLLCFDGEADVESRKSGKSEEVLGTSEMV
ncbi:hypothetical protein BP6252_02812 [Coleophoma cylindrospora]|uniref:Uncharacterized protein n=1 Tax=Coleophoma cylindrospora TaxID=1849047 RepID=A0A3D8SFY3_9HELO|nr:hypothetical protein BP6252_02812 [Coleophoma cylindrospora]